MKRIHLAIACVVIIALVSIAFITNFTGKVTQQSSPIISEKSAGQIAENIGKSLEDITSNLKNLEEILP